jgi:FKBP-type peptidyl-prolyl cis-trans isomerase 2
MVIKKQDFVEIEYTGKLKDDDFVFDTTDEKIAKDNEVYNPDHQYGPIKIMIGGNQVLPGLDRFMEGKEPGEYTINLSPQEGFGKKNAQLLKLIPKKVFTKQQINPMPGLPVNIDGANGMVKTVSGGRCMVDFNHPLSGKELVYNVKINKIVTDEKEKVAAILELQTKKENFDLNVEGEKVIITLKNKGFQKPLLDLMTDMIKKFTKIKTVEFAEEKSETKK